MNLSEPIVAYTPGPTPQSQTFVKPSPFLYHQIIAVNPKMSLKPPYNL